MRKELKKTEDKQDIKPVLYPPTVEVITDVDKNHNTIGISHLDIENKHHRDTAEVKPLCGKKFKGPNIRVGGGIEHVQCEKCRKKYLSLYREIIVCPAKLATITERTTKYNKVFVFCEEAPFVKQVRFSQLQIGNIFYMEGLRHDIDVYEEDGSILWQVKEAPVPHWVNTKFEPIDWSCMVLPVTQVVSNLKKAGILK